MSDKVYLVIQDLFEGGWEVERAYLDRAEAQEFMDAYSVTQEYSDYEIQELALGRPPGDYDGPGWRINWNCGLRMPGDDPSDPAKWRDSGPYEHKEWLTGPYLDPTVRVNGGGDIYRQHFVSACGVDKEATLKALHDAVALVKVNRLKAA